MTKKIQFKTESRFFVLSISTFVFLILILSSLVLSKSENSNANKTDLKIDKEMARSIASEKLKSNEINISLNADNNYEVVASKNGKFLFLFNKNMKIKAYINSETGEIRIKKPWWAFLVFGEDKPVMSKVTVCHVSGNRNITINIADASLQAHLAHNDTIGPCSNNNNITNVNLTRMVILMKNKSRNIYNTSLVSIDSLSNEMKYTIEKWDCDYIIEENNKTYVSGCRNVTYGKQQ